MNNDELIEYAIRSSNAIKEEVKPKLIDYFYKQEEAINKAIELLGNYKHYSTPDEKQNGDNEDLVNNAFDTLKEVQE